MRAALLLLAVAGSALAQEAEIQRAVMELDQRTVEFAARLNGAPLVDLQRLENAFARQRLEVLTEPVAPALRPYQRQAAARENEGYVLQLPPPVVRSHLPSALPPCSERPSEDFCAPRRGLTLND